MHQRSGRPTQAGSVPVHVPERGHGVPALDPGHLRVDVHIACGGHEIGQAVGLEPGRTELPRRPAGNRDVCRAVTEVGERQRDAPVEVALLELNRREEEAHGLSAVERGELFHVVMQPLLNARLGHGEDVRDLLARGAVAEELVALVRPWRDLVPDRVRDLVACRCSASTTFLPRSRSCCLEPTVTAGVPRNAALAERGGRVADHAGAVRHEPRRSSPGGRLRKKWKLVRRGRPRGTAGCPSRRPPSPRRRSARRRAPACPIVATALSVASICSNPSPVLGRHRVLHHQEERLARDRSASRAAEGLEGLLPRAEVDLRDEVDRGAADVEDASPDPRPWR